MKKIIMILILLMVLPQIARADTLQQYLNAPTHYELEPYSTATGKSTFVFDADVVIPELEYETIPIYEVGLHSFTDDEIITIASALGYENAANIKKEIQKPVKPWNPYGIDYYLEDKNRQFFVSNNYNQNTMLPHNTLAEYRIVPSKKGDTFFSAYSGMKIQAVPHSLSQEGMASLASATEIAKKLAQKIAPDLQYDSVGVMEGEAYASVADIERYNTIGDNKKELEALQQAPKAYIFNFNRSLNGLPITVTSEGGGGRNRENPEPYTDFYVYERFTIIVSGDEVKHMRFDSPYEMLGIWKKDCGELLSFEQAMNIAETILPLKYASQEYMDVASNEYLIHRISFGYTRVMMPDEPDRCILIPVWDIFGTKSWIDTNGKTGSNNNMYGSLITINAMDGTIIDREMGY